MLVEEINLKLVILGDGGVGKTSLINSLLGKTIPKMYVPTIGSNIARKENKLKNFLVRVYLWDIGGQKSFNPLNPVFFTNVDAAFLVYDVSQPKESFAELEKTYFPNLSKYSENCITFIVGNKLDLVSSSKELKDIVAKYSFKGLPLVFTSAKTKENVIEILDLLTFNFLKAWEQKYTSEKFKGISIEFLKLVGRDEKELEKVFVNLESIDSITLEKKAPTEVVKEAEVEDEASDESVDEIIAMREKIKLLDEIKGKLTDSFDKNLEAVKDLVLNLKQTPIGSLVETIDTTAEQLEQIKSDFEINLESLLSVESDEAVAKNKTKEKGA